MLTWGLKQSLRAYVERAGGSIQTARGAERSPIGEFTFAAAQGQGLTQGPDGALAGVGAFVGEVTLEAHGGMLKIVLADLRVEIDGERGVLTAAGGPDRDKRVELAVLDLAAAKSDDGEVVIPTKLSKDGWRVVGDEYLPMTPLDPVRLTLGT